MAEPTLNAYLSDLEMNTNRLDDIVDEVARHIADGNLDGAALVLGSQTGKIGRFTESYRALEDKLGEEGADPQRALKSDPEADRPRG